MDERINQLAIKLQQHNRTPADLASTSSNTPKITIFAIAYAYYLLTLDNELTRERYRTVIDHYIRFCSNIGIDTPLTAIGLDVFLWRDDLIRTGGVGGALPGVKLDRFYPLAKSSIRNKVDILSAFYKFLNKPGLDGSDPLMNTNPVEALRKRFTIEKYANSKKISLDSFKKILKEINIETVKGMRDYALLYGYFMTGKRNTEWVTLQWKSLNFNTNPPTFSFTRKGQKTTTDILPVEVARVLIAYLRKRYGENFQNRITEETYLFTAMPGRGGTRQIIDPNHPLTERSILRIVKGYAKEAGLNPKKITVHSLRHLHAEAYLKLGANVEEIRSRLGHKNLGTTQIYASSFEEQQNRLAGKLDELLNE